MIRRTALPVLSILTVLTLTGCGGSPGGGGSPSPTVEPTITAGPTPSATPTPTPTPEPEPEPDPEPPAPPSETAVTARGAYDLCVTHSRPYFAAGPVYAPYSSAQVVARTDGLFYVYIEVTVTSAPTDAQKYVAAECILGGTVENPRLEMYGARTRAPASERDPNAPLPTES